MAEECRFYYYESGYCCEAKRKMEDNSSIDRDTVHRYCWGYHYEECPRYKSYMSGSSTSCFLTSACVEAKGLPDDCHELTVLRAFRDGYMRSLPEGQVDICEYYHTAPVIVERIKALPNAREIFDSIYSELVLPCVKLIENDQKHEAYIKYKDYTKALKSLYC